MKQTCLKTNHDRHHSPTRQPTHPLTHPPAHSPTHPPPTTHQHFPICYASAMGPLSTFSWWRAQNELATACWGTNVWMRRGRWGPASSKSMNTPTNKKRSFELLLLRACRSRKNSTNLQWVSLGISWVHFRPNYLRPKCWRGNFLEAFKKRGSFHASHDRSLGSSKPTDFRTASQQENTCDNTRGSH